jgi:hypothetical protein
MKKIPLVTDSLTKENDIELLPESDTIKPNNILWYLLGFVVIVFIIYFNNKESWKTN